MSYLQPIPPMLAHPQASASFGPMRPRIARADAPLVLVADDHESSREVARLVLESAGYRVVEAATGIEALAIARVDRPRVVLLDVVMPGLDGWSVARRLRADPLTARITLITLTALASAADRDASLASGCDDVLTKPIHPRMLLSVLGRYATLM